MLLVSETSSSGRDVVGTKNINPHPAPERRYLPERFEDLLRIVGHSSAGLPVPEKPPELLPGGSEAVDFLQKHTKYHITTCVIYLVYQNKSEPAAAYVGRTLA